MAGPDRCGGLAPRQAKDEFCIFAGADGGLDLRDSAVRDPQDTSFL
jgi:hypothetical protein